MNLKTIGLAIGALGTTGAVFVFGGGFVLPRHMKVQRSVEIAATPSTIHAFVGDLSRWEQWTSWNTNTDSSLRLKFEGASSQTGKMTWNGDLLGQGVLAITASSAESGIDYDLALQDGHFSAKGSVRYAPAGANTTVTWTDESDLGSNPLSHWFGPMLERSVGEDYASNLARLKSLAEQAQRDADARTVAPDPIEKPAGGGEPPQPPADPVSPPKTP